MYLLKVELDCIGFLNLEVKYRRVSVDFEKCPVNGIRTMWIESPIHLQVAAKNLEMTQMALGEVESVTSQNEMVLALNISALSFQNLSGFTLYFLTKRVLAVP